MRWIDRFCAKHPRFGVPNLMMYIIIGNIAAFLFIWMDTTGNIVSFLMFDAALVLKGQMWRLFTFIFFPPSFDLLSLAITLYFYYFIGTTLEREWGPEKFTLYYISGAVCTIFYSFLVDLIFGGGGYVTAHYINMSMFFCFATLYPDLQFMLFFIIPVKAKWLAWIDAVYFLLMALRLPGFMKLLPLVAVLSYPLFCWNEIKYIIRPLRARTNRKTVNFKRAARQARHDEQYKTYSSKCEICGKTDTQYPNLEFRYCSRCAGYHCYCEEHIGNHKHLAE